MTGPAIPPTATQTHSGRVVSLVAPDPATIDFADIAGHLSRIPRFAGATLPVVSVAMHSIWVADCLKHDGRDEEVQAYGLLHDAHEAYCGDIPRPMLHALEAVAQDDDCSAYAPRSAVNAIHSRLDVAIWSAAGLEPIDMIAATYVAMADARALETERRRFLDTYAARPLPRWPWDDDPPELLPFPIFALDSARAAKLWLAKARALLPSLRETRP